MSKKVDINGLSELAHLDLTADELEKLESEIPGILSFVDVIQKAPSEMAQTAHGLENVMREDGDAHEGGIYTEALLSAAPARKGHRIAVKQVIRRDR